MGSERVRVELANSRFADVRWTDETGSTNTDAMEILLENRRDDPASAKAVVVVSEHQSAGRGRLDRQWQAPPGASLLMSLGTTDHIDPSRRSLLLTALGLAAIDACESVTGFRPSLKWPNDLVARPPEGGVERKLGGILAEAQSAGDGVATVVGLGLNCNWISGDGPGIPDELSEVAISLDQLAGGAVDREVLMVEIVRCFEANLGRLSSSSGVESLLAEARANSATLGREVRIELGKSEFVGTASDVDSEGALLVTDPAGKVHRVVVGDVVHLRPLD